MPSDADLMKIAIGDLNNSSISLEDRQRALQELLVLVEPIDNANGKSVLEICLIVCLSFFSVHLCATCCSAYEPKYAYIHRKLRQMMYRRALCY
jgi:hypothetical protein